MKKLLLLTLGSFFASNVYTIDATKLFSGVACQDVCSKSTTFHHNTFYRLRHIGGIAASKVSSEALSLANISAWNSTAEAVFDIIV